MKKVSRRALFALALAAVLAVGTLAFCVKYAVNAEKWVTFSGSPHVYTGTNLSGGKIYDRTGVRILNTHRRPHLQLRRVRPRRRRSTCSATATAISARRCSGTLPSR